MRGAGPYVDDESMATTDSSLPPGNDGAARDETIAALMVHGTLPAGLSGRLVAIGRSSDGGAPGAEDGMIHAVELHAGRATSYRSRWVITDAVAKRLGINPSPGPGHTGRDVVASNIVTFGGSILALGEGALAYELTHDLDTLRRVDLAGQSRGLSPYPKRDPISGDLHVLAVAASGAQSHVVVSAGALTRTSRSIADAPNQITDLAITRDHVVFVTDGFVGVTSRDREAHTTWIATGSDAPHLVHAEAVGDTIVIDALTPALERWTVSAASATVHREVLDPTPRRFGRTNARRAGVPLRYLWTGGGVTVDKYDLLTPTRVRHRFPPHCRPDDLAFVRDDARPSDADGGWLVGFVQHASKVQTDLIVLDAADIARPALATVRIPRRIQRELRCTWIPSQPPEAPDTGDRS